VLRLSSLFTCSVVVAAVWLATGEASYGQSGAAAPVAAVAPDRLAAVPSAQPPVLSPQEQAVLDQLLAAWEARNAAVRTWSCTFHKWEYNAWSPADANGERLAFAESAGELKYAAPDKGLFRVKESKQWSPEARRYEVRSGDFGEHWVCNGESIYEYRHTERQLRETKLPPEMRGKAISDGPLPFVFGAKAETLKKRYWMRIITPAEVRDQVWLEALPRYQADAANFSKVELILQARDLMPFAIQLYKPGGNDRDVYQFDPRTNLIDKGLDMIRDFAKPMTPFGYKYVLEDLQAQSAPPAAPPR
jgi:TIGR03009 family protein